MAVAENNGAIAHGRKLVEGAILVAEELFPHLVLTGGGEGRAKPGAIDASSSSTTTKSGNSNSVVVDHAQIATPPVFRYVSASPSPEISAACLSAKRSVYNGSKVGSEVKLVCVVCICNGRGGGSSSSLAADKTKMHLEWIRYNSYSSSSSSSSSSTTSGRWWLFKHAFVPATRNRKTRAG